MEITWQTVAGKCYLIEYTDESLSENPEFTSTGSSVQAVAEKTSFTVQGAKQATTRHYRVRLVDCP